MGEYPVIIPEEKWPNWRVEELLARNATLEALLREARGLLGEEHTTRCRHGYADPPGCEIDDLAHKIDAALEVTH